MVPPMTTKLEPAFLDLGKAISVKKNTILTGKERGIAAREILNVEELYNDNDLVVILVPDNVVGISSSFINGLLSTVVEQSGGFEKFFPRLVIDAPPRIIEGIIQGLKLGALPPLKIGS